MKTVVLSAMSAGVVLAILGVLISVVMRRPDVRLSAVLMAGSELATRTETYVRPTFVRAVKILNMLAVCLFLAGVIIIVWLASTGTRFE